MSEAIREAVHEICETAEIITFAILGVKMLCGFLKWFLGKEAE